MEIDIRTIVIGCPEGPWSAGQKDDAPRELASFYAELLGMRIIREDWLVIAKDEKSVPRLAFDEPPAGRDPTAGQGRIPVIRRPGRPPLLPVSRCGRGWRRDWETWARPDRPRGLRLFQSASSGLLLSGAARYAQA